MPSPPSAACSGPSRRQFLRTAAATTGVGLTTSIAGCSTRTPFSGVNVHVRSQAVESPPLGLVKTGVWLVAVGRGGEVVGMDRGDGERRWTVDTGVDLTTPPAADDGRVYVAGEHVVSADSGTERWRTPLPGVASALAVDAASDVVAVGTEDGVVTAVNGDDSHVVEAADGDRLWQTTLTTADGDPARVDALAATSGVVYAGSRDGVAVAFDTQTGTVEWRTDAVVSTVAAAGPRTLLGRRRVTCVRDGEGQWRAETGNDWTTAITPAERWYLTGARTDGDGYVLSLTNDGERRWRHRLTGDGVALSSVVNGRFVVGVEGDRPGVHQFTTDGESAWFFETETSVVDVVWDGDRVWALTASGELLALSQ